MIYPSAIEPHHDLVIVRRVDQSKTPTGIILPAHSSRQESHIAKVVSVGPGVVGRPETIPACKPGEYWLIARFIGTVVPINGADHTIVKWNDCQCRLSFDAATLALLDDSFCADTAV